MSLIQTVNAQDGIANGLRILRADVAGAIHRPEIGLGAGLLVASLAGAPASLSGFALLGPWLAFAGAGAAGARATSAVGFVSYLIFASPSLAAIFLAGMVSIALAWGIPTLLERHHDPQESEAPASTIVIECDGFASLDETYGAGAGDHVFALLHRALKHEVRDDDLVVNPDGRQLILVIEGSTPEIVASTLERVEARFAGWLDDAGYECNLSVDLSSGRDEEEARFEKLMRAGQAFDGPYMD